MKKNKKNKTNFSPEQEWILLQLPEELKLPISQLFEMYDSLHGEPKTIEHWRVFLLLTNDVIKRMIGVITSQNHEIEQLRLGVARLSQSYEELKKELESED